MKKNNIQKMPKAGQAGNGTKPLVVGSLLGTPEIKFKVFFYDANDFATGEFISFNEAMAENYVEWDEYELKPTDECSIIVRFTGFYDKNYNPIFEGDVISKQGAFVCWSNILGCWCFQFKDCKTPPVPLYYDDNLKNAEVLGSVFTHPEFLG